MLQLYNVMLNPIKTYVLLCFSFVLFSVSGQNSNRVITTSVPFLLITPDARAAGMGELGVATAAVVILKSAELFGSILSLPQQSLTSSTVYGSIVERVNPM
mgnify:CR=1 FL=1